MEQQPDEPAANILPATARRDGWTPFCRRLFLEVLAETGRVSQAVEYCQLTKQSAYALRARDPLFAASWDAACELARAPLADALYEKALDGGTETITKDGEVVAERHRYDSRLSIAVLHRLDKRCDRAAETGSRHLALVHHWDEWMALVGRGEEQSAQALLDSPVLSGAEGARHSQLGQLPLGENPTDEEEDEVEEVNLWDRCWKDDGLWMTSFPPPPGFTGYEKRKWGEFRYERECTPEEAEILEAHEAAAQAAEREEKEEQRDSWFALLKAELAAGDGLEDAPPDADEQQDGQDVPHDQGPPDADRPAAAALVDGIAIDGAFDDPQQHRDHQHEVNGEAPQDAGMVGSAHRPASVDRIGHGPDGQDQAEDEEQLVGIVAHRRLSPRDHRADAIVQDLRAGGS